MFALYPSAAMGELTAPAWFDLLSPFDLRVVCVAMDKASQASPEFIPTGPKVREHCVAVAKTSIGQPAPNLSLVALPEPEEEVPPALADIRDRLKRGEIAPADASREYTAWISGVLG